MIEIRFAGLNEIDKIENLWYEGFGHKDSYFKLYKDKIYSYDNVLVLCLNRKIVSMVTILKTKIKKDKKVYNAACFYALATLNKYRGKNFAVNLINYALKYYFERDIDIAFLHPATESLYNFYRCKCGFKDLFNINQFDLGACQIPTSNSNLYLETCSVKEYFEIRNRILSNSCYVEWDKKQIEYAKSICEFTKGNLVKFTMDNKNEACASINLADNGNVYIKELLFYNLTLIDLLSEIIKKYPSESYSLRLPDYINLPYSKVVPFGMVRCKTSEIYNILNRNLYYGFAFD